MTHSLLWLASLNYLQSMEGSEGSMIGPFASCKLGLALVFFFWISNPYHMALLPSPKEMGQLIQHLIVSDPETKW